MAGIMSDLSNQNKKKVPMIGMRIVKSALGIFICFLIDILRNGAGIVFYSQLAVHDSFNMEGCSILRIYNKNASKENMLDYLKQKLGIENTVTFGTIEGKYDYIIEAGDFNKVVKIMRRKIQSLSAHGRI